MGYNGRDLIDEFADELGDRTSNFKLKVLTWINDVERDVCKQHSWGFLRTKGTKIMVASQEEQVLSITAPNAPSVAIASGGSLTENSVYKVKITHYDPTSKNEIASDASASVTATASNKTINVTSISTTTEAFFTQRRVYLSKDGGEYYLVATITNQSATSTTITADASSRIIAPDFDYIRGLDQNPFYESNQGQLDYLPIDQMRLLFSGQFTDGTPENWSDLAANRILLYPRPSSTTALSFYYFKVPRGIYYDIDSFPTLPISLKKVLKAGVLYYGNKFRDRNGWQAEFDVYQQAIKDAIEDMGKPIKVATRVRNVLGDNDGWAY